MATNTTKVGLRKPAGSDTVSVVFDIADNMDKVDARMGDKKKFTRTAGNLTVNTTNYYTPLGGAGSTLTDLIMKAVAGDWIEVAVSGLWENNVNSGYLDAWSRVAGVQVNSWGGNNAAAPIAGHAGALAWFGVQYTAATFAGSAIRQVVAGDIDGTGQVTIGLGARVNTGSKFIYGTPDIPLMFHMINHGNP